MIEVFVFYLFATFVIAAAAMTILARNPVHSVLWLILAFFNGAGLMLLAGAEFIALLLVIVYVGAVAVLFLFVVMMLDVDFAALRSGFARYFPFGLAVALTLLAEIILAVAVQGTKDLSANNFSPPGDNSLPNIEALGVLLYTRYLFVFEIAGLVLLVAMIGAIVLTHRSRSGTRSQDISRQVRRRPKDAVRKISQPVGHGVEL